MIKSVSSLVFDHFVLWVIIHTVQCVMYSILYILSYVLYILSYSNFFLFQNTCDYNPVSARPRPARSSTMVSHSSIATLMNAPFEDSKAPIPSPATPEASARKRVTVGIDSSPGSRPDRVSHSSGSARLKRSHLKSCSTTSIATLMSAPFKEATAPLPPSATPEPPARKHVTFGIDSSPGSRPDRVSHSSGSARLKRSHLKSCSTTSITTLMSAPFKEATAPLPPSATPEPPARKRVKFDMDLSPSIHVLTEYHTIQDLPASEKAEVPHALAAATHGSLSLQKEQLSLCYLKQERPSPCPCPQKEQPLHFLLSIPAMSHLDQKYAICSVTAPWILYQPHSLLCPHQPP